jgi:hypothetical protein
VPRPRTGNKPIFVRLTSDELELLQQEKVSQRLPSLSAVVEKAICTMLDASNIGRDGLKVPAAHGELLDRTYRLSPKTIERLNILSDRYKFSVQDILRASLDRLAQKSPPTYDI